MAHLLEAKDISVTFGKKRVTQGINFFLDKGELLGIVGESGSGKSVTMHAIMHLLAENGRASGSALFMEKSGAVIDLMAINDRQVREKSGTELSVIFQEPMTSLNPVVNIGCQISEMLKLHTDMSKYERIKRVREILTDVGLAADDKSADGLMEKFPHELSGGMRQRVMLAMAMILRPSLLIADEPTTALDVTVQAKILEVMKKLSGEYGTSIIFISHDLGVIRKMCTRVVVMCSGKVVETGNIEDIFKNPRENYTKVLLNAAMHSGRLKSGKRLFVEQESPVLEVSGLNVYYDKGMEKPIVKSAGLVLKKGEILGLVGESGCGKSTLAKAIVGLNSKYTGTIRTACRHPQMVFQDPYGSLNPSKKIGWLLKEPLRLHMVHTSPELLAKGIHVPARKYTRKEMDSRMELMLDSVGLNRDYAQRYPEELSGGERQRAAIAMALMLGQEVIVLDEPVSALDVTVEEKILELLVDLKDRFGLSYIFITHDMNVVSRLCDRVCVMYGGAIVEEGPADEVLKNPSDGYTKKLINAVLKL
jgi:ABC-type glutathione transport system ATPase component